MGPAGGPGPAAGGYAVANAAPLSSLAAAAVNSIVSRATTRHLLPLLAAAGMLLSAAPAAAQGTPAADDGREELRLGMAAVSRGDTLAALTHFERAVVLAPELAEAHFRVGLVYAERASTRQTDFEDRMRAQSAFEEAIRLEPDHPRYYLELARLMLKQQIRVDARRVLARALEVAERADPRTLAETHFQLALFHETQWERLRIRQNLPLGFEALDPERAIGDARHVWRMLEDSRPPPAGQGAADRSAMLEHLHAALAADATHMGALARMLAYLYDEGEMPEFVARAERAADFAPAEALPLLALGLARLRGGNTVEAGRSFAAGLQRLAPDQREHVENLRLVLDRDGEQAYERLTPAQRAEYRRRFWVLADPFYLTAENEYWLEFMKRMTYADLRYSIPEYGTRGWETDRGEIYVRYGEPLRRATFAANALNTGVPGGVGQVTTVWAYGPEGPVFFFSQNAGFRRARFSGDFAWFAEDYRSVTPARLADPAAPPPLAVPMQVARFRGADGAVDVEVHALLPLRRLAVTAPEGSVTVRSGVVMRDSEGRDVARVVSSDVVEARTAGERPASWRAPVRPGGVLMVAVEAHAATGAAAASRVPVEPVAFPAGQLGVSDLLLGSRVAPLTAEPRGRQDFRVDPSPGLSFVPGAPIAVYYELYNLLPDAEQLASYEIEIAVTVKELYRSGAGLRRLLGDLADKWGLTQEGGEAAKLRYVREARVLARDLIPEHHRLELPDPPPGRYALRLTVRDRIARREASVTREFEVRAE